MKFWIGTAVDEILVSRPLSSPRSESLPFAGLGSGDRDMDAAREIAIERKDVAVCNVDVAIAIATDSSCTLHAERAAGGRRNGVVDGTRNDATIKIHRRPVRDAHECICTTPT